MTVYVDYEYYKDEFKGTDIPKESFDKFSLEASRKIKYFITSKIHDEIINEVKDATCSSAEFLYQQNEYKKNLFNNNQEISSETVGPHSKSYVNKSSLREKQILNEREKDQEIYRICKQYLYDTDLLYRG